MNCVLHKCFNNTIVIKLCAGYIFVEQELHVKKRQRQWHYKAKPEHVDKILVMFIKFDKFILSFGPTYMSVVQICKISSFITRQNNILFTFQLFGYCGQTFEQRQR